MRFFVHFLDSGRSGERFSYVTQDMAITGYSTNSVFNRFHLQNAYYSD